MRHLIPSWGVNTTRIGDSPGQRMSDNHFVAEQISRRLNYPAKRSCRVRQAIASIELGDFPGPGAFDEF